MSLVVKPADLSAPKRQLSRTYDRDMYKFACAVPSYWEATASPFVASRLVNDLDVEVAIVGGGYLGLSAALHLARDYGISVAVLEAGHFGWGASGRNGGINSFATTKLSIDTMLRRYGQEETRRFFASQLAGQKLVLGLAQAEDIDIAACGDGLINVAHNRSAFARLQQYAEQLKTVAGIRSHILTPSEFREVVHIGPDQHGGLRVWPGCAIHPLSFARGLARAAEKYGARLFEHSEIVAHQHIAGHHILRTDRATVRSKHVIFAMNGYHPDGLQDEMDARIVPAIANIMVTRPLSKAELAVHRYETDTPVVNTRHLLFYYRKLQDDRILFGARGDLVGSSTAAERMRRKMQKYFACVFPEWATIDTAFFWRGLVALTRKRAPSLGRLEGEGSAWYGFGCHGEGINTHTWMGRAVACHIARGRGDIDVPAIYRGLPRKVPPSMFLRRAGLGLAYARYAMADAIT